MKEICTCEHPIPRGYAPDQYCADCNKPFADEEEKAKYAADKLQHNLFDIVMLAINQEESNPYELVSRILFTFDEWQRSRGWISVEERLPKLGEVVIVGGGLAFYDGELWFSAMHYSYNREIQWKVTHWQPLPQPPKPKQS